jgi:hypothetical protein
MRVAHTRPWPLAAVVTHMEVLETRVGRLGFSGSSLSESPPAGAFTRSTGASPLS